MQNFVMCDLSTEMNIAELALAAFAVVSRRSMGMIRDVKCSIYYICI